MHPTTAVIKRPRAGVRKAVDKEVFLGDRRDMLLLFALLPCARCVGRDCRGVRAQAVRNFVLSSPTRAMPSGAITRAGSKYVKIFFLATSLQSADAGDEQIFRVGEYYSGAGRAWQV
jgi:hypothetical protein